MIIETSVIFGVAIATDPSPCSSADKALFTPADAPSVGLRTACIDRNDFANGCFYESEPESSDYVLDNLALTQTCSNCIYDLMTTTLQGTASTVSQCLSTTNNDSECLTLVDSLILNNCAADWFPQDDETTAAPEDDEDNEENETTAAPE